MTRLRRALEASWYSGSSYWPLRPLSALFGWVVTMRRWAFRRQLLASGQAGVPVIIVGNISVGGTGKTPLVLWLVQQLQAEGLQVGVISRGYGSRPHPVPRLVEAAATPDEAGDEAVLLARRAKCAVCVGRDRLSAARLLAAKGCQVIIADDGLQHYALRRNMEIAVVDGERGMGNGLLLPAGPLREPAQRLTQVDAVVVKGETNSSATLANLRAEQRFAMALQPQRLVHLLTGASASLEAWRGRSVHAVAGIGNPGQYFALLRSMNLNVTEHAFSDHYSFRAADLSFADQRDIVMTEKDAVKCLSFATERMWYLSVAVQFKADDGARLLKQVRSRIAET